MSRRNKLVVIAILVILVVIISSNLYGWKAIVEIKKVTRQCDNGECKLRAYLNDYGLSYYFPEESNVQAGDIMVIYIKCNLKTCENRVLNVIHKSQSDSK